MRGTVAFVHPESNGIVVETSEWFVVVEVHDSIAIEIDDVISGDLDDLGTVTLKHVSSAESFDGFIQDRCSSLQAAKRSLG